MNNGAPDAAEGLRHRRSEGGGFRGGVRLLLGLPCFRKLTVMLIDVLCYRLLFSISGNVFGPPPHTFNPPIQHPLTKKRYFCKHRLVYLFDVANPKSDIVARSLVLDTPFVPTRLGWLEDDYVY